ncbi:MAG: HEAT repeat domain-containing protein [Bacteroidales bacterium]|nr:HEAT repeat domain-containing protein [Bacteroidales bacterium]
MLLITISKINKWGQQGKVTKLLEALSNENEEIRKAAALTLGRIGHSGLVDNMKIALLKETDIFVRFDIESAIKLLESQPEQILVSANIQKPQEVENYHHQENSNNKRHYSPALG